MAQTDVLEDELVRRAAIRLSAVTTGVGVGLVGGLGLFVATIWLVIKGGPTPGAHLGLLSQFLPGYSVTLGGAAIGLIYAVLIGYCTGFLVAKIYNALAR